MSDVEENNKTPQWDSNLSFLMAMIGCAVGLGNIWRYSYVLYSNGGGAFFIPYITAILLMGIPFLILEYGMGATFKDSISNIFKHINPKFEVFGWIVTTIVFIVLAYYIVIIGWDLVYLVLSFFKGWGSNPDNFFMTNIVVGANDLSGLTTFVWPTVLAVIVVWIAVWYIAHKSLNDGLSKVVDVLIPALFIIMAIIVVYSFTLPGMWNGLRELLNPNWGLLLDVRIWLAAFGQIIFSLAMGEALAMTYASYLPENSKLIDNVLMVILSNSSFEVFTALGVFATLGFMSLTTHAPIGEIATSGSGLLFVVYPAIFNAMGFMAYIIGPLFFLAILFAGITSALSFLEQAGLSISKKFNTSRSKTMSILCFAGLLLSLLFSTASGNYLLTITDSFLNQFGVLLMIIVQAIVFGWIYGIEKLLPVLNKNSTIKVGKTWMTIIKYILPAFLAVIWIMGLHDLFSTQSMLDTIIEVVLILVITIVPIIFARLPSKTMN